MSPLQPRPLHCIRNDLNDLRTRPGKGEVVRCEATLRETLRLLIELIDRIDRTSP